MEDWKSYLLANEDKFLEDFIEFLKIPSLSTLPEHAGDVQRAASWLASRMESAGLENVEVLETHRHPVVYGDWMHAEGAPTVLLYGHYDVQPADPLELWQTGPFDPTVRNGRLYARGASDMKGNVLLMVHAVEAHLATAGKLPVNVKFLIEGEEEIGSPSLPSWLEQNRERIACDYVASSDSAQISMQVPTVIIGSKGMCGVEIDVKTAPTDLHSGLAGGVVYNALHVLADIVSSFRDADHKILVDGFYDDVAPPTEEDREMCRRMPIGEADFQASIGVKQLISEAGYTPMEQTWFRPTLEVNGMWGGFQGDGSKTVIPCEAHAKITCRLVANQNPKKIAEQLKAHVARHTPDGVEVSVTTISGWANAYLLPSDCLALHAADRALADVMGHEPIHFRMGATVPILDMLKGLLGVDVVSLGFGGLSDGIHAPNESMDLTLWGVGPKVYARFFECLALVAHEVH